MIILQSRGLRAALSFMSHLVRYTVFGLIVKLLVDFGQLLHNGTAMPDLILAAAVLAVLVIIWIQAWLVADFSKA